MDENTKNIFYDQCREQLKYFRNNKFIKEIELSLPYRLETSNESPYFLLLPLSLSGKSKIESNITVKINRLYIKLSVVLIGNVIKNFNMSDEFFYSFRAKGGVINYLTISKYITLRSKKVFYEQLDKLINEFIRINILYNKNVNNKS